MRKNDQLAWALLVSCIGFIIVVVSGILLKGLVIRKFSANSQELVRYYYWGYFAFDIADSS
jgi:ferritin-like protein